MGDADRADAGLGQGLGGGEQIGDRHQDAAGAGGLSRGDKGVDGGPGLGVLLGRPDQAGDGLAAGAGLDDAQRVRLMADGYIEKPSQYGEAPYRFTRALIEDGRVQRLLDGPLAVRCKLRLLQGQRDPDVPWGTALAIAERVASEDVEVVLIKDGDHRLSRPADLALLGRTVAALLDEDGASPRGSRDSASDSRASAG